MEINGDENLLVKIKSKVEQSIFAPPNQEKTDFIEIIVDFSVDYPPAFSKKKMIELQPLLLNIKNKKRILISPLSLRKNDKKLFLENNVLFSKTNDINPELKDQPLNNDQNHSALFYKLFKESNSQFLNSESYFIQEPGEYEIETIYIKGVADFDVYKDQLSSVIKKKLLTVYTIKTEEMNVCCVWEIPDQELTTIQLKNIGQVNVLIIPFNLLTNNKSNKIDFVHKTKINQQARAISLIDEIDPQLTILVTPLDSQENNNIEKLIQQSSDEKNESTTHLIIQKKDILNYKRKIVFLRTSN